MKKGVDLPVPFFIHIWYTRFITFIAKDKNAMSKKSTKLEVLCEAFREKWIISEALEGNGVLIQKIKELADAVPDYRHPSYTRHQLGDIIIIVFFAVGYTDAVKPPVRRAGNHASGHEETGIHAAAPLSQR